MNKKISLVLALIPVLMLCSYSYAKKKEQQQKSFCEQNDCSKIDPHKKAIYENYMGYIQQQISANWKAPDGEKFSRDIKARFTVNPDGNISNLELMEKSGSLKMDQSALEAIKDSAPFVALDQPATIEFTFDYNLLKPDPLMPFLKKEAPVKKYDASKPYSLDAIIIDKKDKLSFVQPLDCKLGKDCFILLYPDQASGEEAKDFNCGSMTFDNNNGTAFALSDEAAMKEGVNVLAAADGVVRSTKKHMPDKRLVSKTDLYETSKAACGNFVVIDHDKEWTSHYCHLKKDSLKVKEGQKIKKGQAIAEVGESGNASFPQVNVIFEYKGRFIDPFVSKSTEAGCGSEKTKSLWAKTIKYNPTGLIKVGFAEKTVDFNDVWSGDLVGETVSSKEAKALVFWVHSYGIRKGDKEKLKVYSPKGHLFAENETLREKPEVDALIYTGRNNSQKIPFGKGTWKAEYELIRDGKTLLKEQAQIKVQ